MQHCLNSSSSVLERQRTHLQWQQQQVESFSIESLLSLQSEAFADAWPNLSTVQLPVVEEELCSPTVSTSVRKEKSSKKRKASDKSLMDEMGSGQSEKRKKGESNGGVEKQQDNRREDTSGDSSKEDSKKKLDYIHVRARRGQATDSHSLAERVRRERISERMKYLQCLVPGCNKITGKAGMLDEIINYVQSLQRQVEFLSMKLATMSPRLDCNMENLFAKEMNIIYNTISAVGMPPELVDPSYLQFNSLQQAANCCAVDIPTSPAELALRRTMNAPISTTPEAILDSCLNDHRTTSGWDNELHNFYGVEFPQGRGSTFSFQSLIQGNLVPSNLKMEM